MPSGLFEPADDRPLEKTAGVNRKAGIGGRGIQK
jgi:hypothetical protein